MVDPHPAAWLLLALGTLGFGCFVWGTIRHFIWQANGSRGAWAVSMLSWVGFLLFVWRVLAAPLGPLWPAAGILFGLSIAMWAWALATTRATPPTLAFTGDSPHFLLDGGPYKWVRHPFYTAYLTFWIGTALAAGSLFCWAAVLVLGTIYWSAARHEEAKFARSDLASGYRAYAAGTGMFLPRATRPRTS